MFDIIFVQRKRSLRLYLSLSGESVWQTSKSSQSVRKDFNMAWTNQRVPKPTLKNQPKTKVWKFVFPDFNWVIFFWWTLIFHGVPPFWGEGFFWDSPLKNFTQKQQLAAVWPVEQGGTIPVPTQESAVKVPLPSDSKWPFYSPSWRSRNLSKRSLNHPKKVTKNCQVLITYKT